MPDPADLDPDALLAMLAERLPAIAERMVEQARPRDTTGTPARLAEATLKQQTRDATSAPARSLGWQLEQHERGVHPDEWPRVGGVDLVYSPAVGARPPVFVELKWGYKDALWNCIWDIAKNALMRRLAHAGRAVVLGGFGDRREWNHRRYGSLLTTRSWQTADFQSSYAADWRCWARGPREGEMHRTGPYRLPRTFNTTLLARQPFRLDGEPWSLGLLDVEPHGDDWLELDEVAQPTVPGNA
jgi:hypothetical protein